MPPNFTGRRICENGPNSYDRIETMIKVLADDIGPGNNDEYNLALCQAIAALRDLLKFY